MNKRGCRGIWEELDVGEREIGLNSQNKVTELPILTRCPQGAHLFLNTKGPHESSIDSLQKSKQALEPLPDKTEETQAP